MACDYEFERDEKEDRGIVDMRVHLLKKIRKLKEIKTDYCNFVHNEAMDHDLEFVTEYSFEFFNRIEQELCRLRSQLCKYRNE